MRTMATSDIFLHASCAALIIFSIVALSIASLHPAWGLLALPAVAVYAALALRRPMRRKMLARQPTPPAWREVLLREVRFYRSLDPDGRERFERNVRYFLAEQKIEGVAGVEITDEIRLLIAAGAAMLLHGQPEWELPQRHTILVYPGGGFDDKFRCTKRGPFLGRTYGQGPVIIALDALIAGWRVPGGDNVALHEFAHLLDMRGARADGIPRMLNPAAAGAWLALVHREMMKVKAHRSLLRAYAAENEAEFFAVAVEYFFERPAELKKRHAELYAALAQFFNQDPAARRQVGQSWQGSPPP
jgi:Mlc titration factor MtfA (ptsG expression regulator)